MTRSTRTVILATTLAVITASCSGGTKKKTVTSAPPVKTTTTTTAPGTTTTTAAAMSPLTGLPPLDGSHLGRPALVVKIDNLDPIARPQTGLTSADICFEEQVEGGITRFACVWQSSNTDLVGPVRSTRTTDIAIVSALNHPLYAFSGGSTSFLAQIRAAPIIDVGADTQPNAYFRFGSKPAPHNLYSRVTTLYGFTPKGNGPPPPQFVYRPTGQPPAAAGAGAATHADVRFPGVGGPSVTWDWDGQKWRRGQNGSADVTTDGGQISAANVVFEYVNYPIVGYQTIAGITGPIPMAQLIGQGPAWVLTGGLQVKANWSKPSPAAVTQFTDAAGAPIKMTPGQTWVELVPLGTPLNLR